ncbi:Uncharacterised protein [Sphingobacterium spiritivorum]|uniref:Uncharacterized protein n=1 Tax=Sphingobacterium spiritivorum TaxID=258 RepID=A0A380CYZ2_SPHSI|nr:Uncharacterised protein [Sphingobacterium spiritivorum]
MDTGIFKHLIPVFTKTAYTNEKEIFITFCSFGNYFL